MEELQIFNEIQLDEENEIKDNDIEIKEEVITEEEQKIEEEHEEIKEEIHEEIKEEKTNKKNKKKNIIKKEDINLEGKYVVKKGDTLESIAIEYNTTWQKIYAKNKFIIGNHPENIKEGQILSI